jgi:hypothetical protein
MCYWIIIQDLKKGIEIEPLFRYKNVNEPYTFYPKWWNFAQPGHTGLGHNQIKVIKAIEL